MLQLFGKRFVSGVLLMFACLLVLTPDAFAKGPSKGKRVDVIREQLSEIGYKAKLDDDGDLVFKSSGYSMLIIVDEDDDTYYRVIVPAIDKLDFESDDADKVVKKIAAAYGISKGAKCVKFCFTDEVLSVSCEGYYASVEDFNESLERLIDMATRGAQKYQITVEDDDDDDDDDE